MLHIDTAKLCKNDNLKQFQNRSKGQVYLDLWAMTPIGASGLFEYFIRLNKTYLKYRFSTAAVLTNSAWCNWKLAANCQWGYIRQYQCKLVNILISKWLTKYNIKPNK